MSPELDGVEANAIAICGFSIKFPQDATSADAFWDMMVNRRCAMTEFPVDRINPSGFCSSHGKQSNKFSTRGGHFIKEDLSVFDAEFFNISPSEASAMDPMQRWLLEAAYWSLENAGITMEEVSGSSTGVYTGCFTNDYLIQLYRDPEYTPAYTATGVGSSMLANRISWFFNLHGPSMAIDSACSSAATALDLACQGLKMGSCDLGMVAGCNLTFAPEVFQSMSHMNFLSPDSVCYSFDQRANGYARGEGIAVIILKRLSDAVKDGNTIRAVIRATACNEDGRTKGITQPSGQAQEKLIRDTYRKAGLSMAHTRYFEAHGTGTPIGDPAEALAVGRAFGDFRSTSDPLYMGAVKSNIGHLEGASALAGVIKAVLVLEKGIIPPNANFEKLNPNIDDVTLGLKFPEQSYDWPTSGLRRASINSFGYGGSNSHIILDDAYNFMRLRNMHGKHRTSIFPSIPSDHISRSPAWSLAASLTSSDPLSSPSELESCTASCASRSSSMSSSSGPLVCRFDRASATDLRPKLLVLSSGDEDGIRRIVDAYENQLATKDDRDLRAASFIDDLAYTLNTRRSHLTWRSFAILRPPIAPQMLRSHISPPIQSQVSEPKIGFVFTGQGAQWAGMGKELMCYSSFVMDLKAADLCLKDLGCTWSACDQLLMTNERMNINVDDPEMSQTLCTVLQIALVNLLRSFGVRPHAVVGHSSGEIASAYAAGILSAESAYKLAYLRGLCSAQATAQANAVLEARPRGAMLSAAINKDDMEIIISELTQETTSLGLTVACENSPRNVTVAGEDSLIDQLKDLLDERDVFVRKLRVPVAYHSRQMEECAAVYESLIGKLSRPTERREHEQVQMVSSVTGTYVGAEKLLSPSYWSRNMVQPVQFSQALGLMCDRSLNDHSPDVHHEAFPAVDHLIELGPHSALRAPIQEILKSRCEDKHIRYSCMLKRGQSAHDTTLNVLGQLFSEGSHVDLEKVNKLVGGPINNSTSNLLLDLPQYPFDHSKSYWHESRISRNFRLRNRLPSDFLGTRCDHSSDTEPTWRHFIKTSELPWSLDHTIDGSILYPAAGMLVMVIEAIRQLTEGDEEIEGFGVNDVEFLSAINLTANKGCVEVETSLRKRGHRRDRTGSHSYDFTVSSYSGSKGDWTINCRGIVVAESSRGLDHWSKQTIRAQRYSLSIPFSAIQAHGNGIEVDSERVYTSLKESGLDFGPHFQVAQHQRYDHARKQTAADIALCGHAAGDQSPLIHPVSLDAMFHLALTALTCGGERRIAATVPTSIANLWLSNKAHLSHFEQRALGAYTEISETSPHGFTCKGVAIDGSHPEVVVWYDGLSMTNVTKNPRSRQHPPDNASQRYLSTQCKPDLDSLETTTICSLLERLHPSQSEDRHTWSELGQIVELSLVQLLKHAEDGSTSLDCAGWRPWKRHYLNWARHHLSKCAERRSRPGVESNVDTSNFCMNQTRERLRNTSHTAELIATVSCHLQSLFDEGASPLEILLQSGILKNYYEELNTHPTTAQIASYIDLLAHQHPGLNFLELGGGTGGGTRNFLRVLSSADNAIYEKVSSRPLRCHSYNFTDVSPTLVDSARVEFGQQYPQMTFNMLDIQRDYSEQGFQDNEYDVVLAVQVLHIASDIKAALRRARKCLKAGGKLILQESLDPSGGIHSFIFGFFPGWWHGAEDGRNLSPNISVETWNTLLQETGFSGVDFVREFGKEIDYHVGWLISTAVDPTPTHKSLPSQHKVKVVIPDTHSDISIHLAEGMSACLSQSACVSSPAMTVTEATSVMEKHEENDILVLMFHENGTGRILDSATGWQQIQLLLSQYSSVLWISGGDQEAKLDHGIVEGLLRTLRHEQPSRHLVSMTIDRFDSAETQISHIVKVVENMSRRSRGAQYEQEYIASDGFLHTQRLVETPDPSARAKESQSQSRFSTIEAPCDGSIPYKLALDPSRDDLGQVPHYIEMGPRKNELQGDEIEILVRGATLELQGDATIGRWSSGIVQSVGPSATARCGDRVCASTQSLTGVCSHVVVPSASVVKIPSHLSFAKACFTIPIFAAAYHAVCEQAQVRSGMSVLVQNGASTLGRAILQVLADQKTSEISVWTTVENEIEASSVSAMFQIQRDNIMPATWLDNSTMMASLWKAKFDLVFLTDMPENANFASSVKSRGRVIMTDTGAKIRENHSRRMANAIVLPSASFSIIDLERIIPTTAALDYAASNFHLQYTSLTSSGNYKVVQASSIGEDPRALDHGTVIVNFDDTTTLQVRKADRSGMLSLMNPHATYVVAGGLGGLGRAISRWLVQNGARYLILLSRSGPKTTQALELLSELRNEGVYIETPSCNIRDKNSVMSVFNDCSERLPAVAGCIQASMVLKEYLFEELSFEDWNAATDPKVRGSWNLHSCLPSGLDFFILLSSIMGIVGTKKLAGYNAGNTYQAALARYRRSIGEHAICMNLGGVTDQGYVAENHGLKNIIFQRNKHILPISMKEVFSLLETFCTPKSNSLRSGLDENPEVTIGLNPPAYWKHKVDTVPFTMSQPFWGHLHNVAFLNEADGSIDTKLQNATAEGMLKRERAMALVRNLSSPENGIVNDFDETITIVRAALVEKIAEILGVAETRIESQAFLHTCGVDSLSAIDLRDWLRRVFNVEITVFEILEGATLQSTSLSIAQQLHAFSIAKK